MVMRVLERLLVVGVADSDPAIRGVVFGTLRPEFDKFLLAPDCLQRSGGNAPQRGGGRKVR